jgi:hypothetical protein
MVQRWPNCVVLVGINVAGADSKTQGAFQGKRGQSSVRRSSPQQRATSGSSIRGFNARSFISRTVLEMGHGKDGRSHCAARTLREESFCASLSIDLIGRLYGPVERLDADLVTISLT